LKQDTVPVGDSIPVGPSAEEEAAMLAVDRTTEEFYGAPPKAENIEPEPGGAPLPPMEDLVKRIPAPARELMEELFRARFVTVKRMPKAALKG
jgi:hypothetical protein